MDSDLCLDDSFFHRHYPSYLPSLVPSRVTTHVTEAGMCSGNFR